MSVPPGLPAMASLMRKGNRRLDLRMISVTASQGLCGVPLKKASAVLSSS
jgi:hypothetical protein